MRNRNQYTLPYISTNANYNVGIILFVKSDKITFFIFFLFWLLINRSSDVRPLINRPRKTNKWTTKSQYYTQPCIEVMSIVYRYLCTWQQCVYASFFGIYCIILNYYCYYYYCQMKDKLPRAVARRRITHPNIYELYA